MKPSTCNLPLLELKVMIVSCSLSPVSGIWSQPVNICGINQPITSGCPADTSVSEPGHSVGCTFYYGDWKMTDCFRDPVIPPFLAVSRVTGSGVVSHGKALSSLEAVERGLTDDRPSAGDCQEAEAVWAGWGMAFRLWLLLNLFHLIPAPTLSQSNPPVLCVFLHPGEAQFLVGGSVGLYLPNEEVCILPAY